MRPLRVIVTRATSEALPWTTLFRQQGFDALNLPLIEIGPPPDPAPVRDAWRRLAGLDAVMFVSANAVGHFFAHRPAVTTEPWPGGEHAPRAWAPGPGTRQALLAAGVPAARIDSPLPDAPQFDSEALWQQVGPQVTAGFQLLVVRGADAQGQGAGREWLSDQLVACGAQVSTVCAYRRRTSVWSEAQRALARAAAGDGSVWIFSSSEAVENLQRLLPGQAWSSARAIATHPRIAGVLEAAGFGVVCRSRPAMGDLSRALESFE